MTVKTRITLWIAGAGIIASLLFSLVVFYELVEQHFNLLDSVLREEADRSVTAIVEGQKGTNPAKYWLEIRNQKGEEVLFRSDMAKSMPLPSVKPGTDKISRVLVPPEFSKPNQKPGKEVVFRIKTFLIKRGGRSFIVQAARPIEKLSEEVWELVFWILIGFVFSTAILIALSRFFAGKILQPVGRMRALAQEISERNLDQRIPFAEGNDEFDVLAKTINRMLDRLQHSFTRQREFLFDTSHELKTPLTTMRLAVGELCSAEAEENIPPFVKENLVRLQNQVLRMEKLVKDLLNLSALETLSGIDRKAVDVTEMLSSLAEDYRFLAEAHNITFETRLPGPLALRGDAEMLRRAFSNVLDNALKYNVEGGQIKLAGDQSPTELEVTVVNTGPGVAESEIPKLFDQFYRVEKSRTIERGGSGLGLAIVKRVIDLHGGKIDLESRQGSWTRVRIHLPRN